MPAAPGMSGPHPQPTTYNGPTTGQKNALICGCNYRYSLTWLKRCLLSPVQALLYAGYASRDVQQCAARTQLSPESVIIIIIIILNF